jgi:hypothetical protein
MSSYLFDDLSERTPVDSGYTEAELEALFDELAKGARFAAPDEPFRLMLAIGLTDGDIVELSDRNTVMLETPRTELERRVAAIREKQTSGTPLQEAIEAALGRQGQMSM